MAASFDKKQRSITYGSFSAQWADLPGETKYGSHVKKRWTCHLEDDSESYNFTWTIFDGSEIDNVFFFGLDCDFDGVANVAVLLQTRGGRPIFVKLGSSKGHHSGFFRRKLFPTNTKMLHCTIWVIADARASAPDSDDEKAAKKTTMAKLLQGDYRSDFKILSGGREFPCNRDFLAMKSNFFRKMFGSVGWKKEEENSLKIDDFGPEAVEQMIRFMHLDETETCSFSLLGIADKYDVEGMFNYVQVRIAEAVDDDNVYDIMYAAYRVPAAKLLQQFCVSFIAGDPSKDVNWWKVVREGEPEAPRIERHVTHRKKYPDHGTDDDHFSLDNRLSI